MILHYEVETSCDQDLRNSYLENNVKLNTKMWGFNCQSPTGGQWDSVRMDESSLRGLGPQADSRAQQEVST